MANMGSKMTPEEIEELMKEVDTAGDGYIYLEDMAERLCPPKNWIGRFRIDGWIICAKAIGI